MTVKFLTTPNSRLILLTTVYIVYIFFGASIFDAIESPHEVKIIRNLNNFVKDFRRKYNNCLTNDELDKFIKTISIANEKGISPLRNVTGEPKWTFGQSIFFSGTVLTTIGYGNVSPLTKGGKIFCIFYAITGIPITLILLTAIIERLMKYTRILLNYLTSKMQPCFDRLCKLSITIIEIRIMFSFLCTLFVLVFFILIPAAIYSSIEGWSYLNAFYYCFISITTVGLGDYVPGDKAVQDHRHFYKICSTAYLIIGVLIVVWLLEIFSEIPEFNLYQHFTLSKDGQLTHHPTKTINQLSNDYIHTITNTNILVTNQNDDDIIGIDLRNGDTRLNYDSPLHQDTTRNNEASID